MSDQLSQKFCRDCYTTTTHKTIVIKNQDTGREYKKNVCLKCLKIRRERTKTMKEYEAVIKTLK